MDDCIVPSTPTLFGARRGDGYENINSPQIHQTRFSFSETSTPTTATLAQSQSSSSIFNTRSTMFSTVSSDIVQVMHEGIADTKVDLTQMQNDGPDRNVPIAEKKVSSENANVSLI